MSLGQGHTTKTNEFIKKRETFNIRLPNRKLCCKKRDPESNLWVCFQKLSEVLSSKIYLDESMLKKSKYVEKHFLNRLIVTEKNE